MASPNGNGTRLWIYDNALKIIGALIVAVFLLFTYEVRCGIDENKKAIQGKVDSDIYERDRVELLGSLYRVEGKVDEIIMLFAGNPPSK